MKHPLIIAVLLAVIAFPAQSWAATYDVDLDHTTVSFKVKHLFSKVQGQFKKFSGTIEYDPAKPETWAAQGTIDATTIDTNVPERDKHLRSADFFETDKYPTITFKTTKVTEATAEGAKVEGLITIHGIEKPIVLNLEVHGVGKDPWGNVRAGFTATTKINRKDFGLTWNQALETGGVLVGDEVDITLEIEGLLKQ